ncbi:MAG: T9SS type A sorting domain-containing protein [Saprospiraceae bacterium]|nr:T9SS type A sorting domain-containing protein [Saprospiraceae bacterium]
MKNQLLFLLCCLACTSLLPAQAWEITPFRGGVEDILEHPDGFYVGTGIDTELGQAVAFRLDADGEIEWKVGLEGRIGYGICQWSDDEFIVMGINTSGPANDITGSFFLTKLTFKGDILWDRQYDDDYDLKGQDIIRTPDNKLVITGGASSDGRSVIRKLTADGDIIYSKEYAGGLPLGTVHALPDGRVIIGSLNFHSDLVVLDLDGEVEDSYAFNQALNMIPVEIISGPNGILTTLSVTTDQSIHFTQISEEGEVIASNDIDRFVVWGSADGAATLDGTYALAGYLWDSEQGQTDSDIFLHKLDENGETVWSRAYGRVSSSGPANEYFGEVRSTADGGFLLCGGSDDMGYVVKTDRHGNIFPNRVQGQVFHDVNEDCTASEGDLSLPSWVVQAAGAPGTFYGVTDEDGNYHIDLPGGVFEISALTLNPYWGIVCSDSRILSFGTEGDTQTLDLPQEAMVSCPIIDVSIVSNRLRRCFPSTYEVDYCNTGTALATNAYIDLTLDPDLILDSADLSYTLMEEIVYRFQIGSLEIGECGTFRVFTTLSCDSSIPLGQVHCVEANSYPDSTCLQPNQSWDGAEIEVEGFCRSDSIFFRIANVGVGNMASPLTYIVIEDQIILFEKTFQLDRGKLLFDTIVGMGAQYTLIAEQSPGGFGSLYPNVSVLNCGGGPTALAVQLPHDDARPSRDVHCLENIDSYDPNDKQASPSGWGDEKLIFPNTQLAYKIRFQNTGTDTAYKVVIKDRIAKVLDIKSIRPGASSHPYTWGITEGRNLSFTFEDIDLPDSTTNLTASQGFVTFTIDQQTDLPLGTLIENTAAIYFDFNPPIFTNTTRHQVSDLFKNLPTDTETVIAPEVSVSIFPQPVQSQAHFHIRGVPQQAVHMQLFDLSGRLVRQQGYENIQFVMESAHLPAGLYIYSLRLEEGHLLQGKLTVY